MIASVLACGYLATAPYTALANVTIGYKKQTNQTQYTRQVFSIDQWPEVRGKLCNKCPNNNIPKENKVSVPEPSSVISLLMIGCFLLLIKKMKLTHPGLNKQ